MVGLQQKCDLELSLFGRTNQYLKEASLSLATFDKLFNMIFYYEHGTPNGLFKNSIMIV
jgi:hypothetical protein